MPGPKRFKGGLLTGEIGKNNTRFAESAIREINEQINASSERLPVFVSFQTTEPPIGRLISSEMVDGELIVRCKIYGNAVVDNLLARETDIGIAPMVEVKRPDDVEILGDEQTRVVHHARLMATAIFPSSWLADDKTSPLTLDE